MSALALGLPLLSSHSWFRPLAEHGLDARQVALGLADLHRVGELGGGPPQAQMEELVGDRKSTRLNSSHLVISYAVFCLKKKKKTQIRDSTNMMTARSLL